MQKILIKNRKIYLTDPDYKGISVGNLILTKDGADTKVIGQLQVENVGSTKNAVEAQLAFYNENSKKIGEVSIRGNNFGVDTRTFVSKGTGDFRTFASVNLHIRAVNRRND